jgi:ATP-dependent Clp protease protease subunit
MWANSSNTEYKNDTLNDNKNVILFRTGNEIHFCDSITFKSATALAMHLKDLEFDILNRLEKQKKTDIPLEDKPFIELNTQPKPIKLFLTTYGGSVYAALKIADVIRTLKVPVHTYVSGYVASAGTIISLTGARRFITSNSFMLIHEIRSGFWGKYSDARDEIVNLDKLSITLIKHIKKYSKLSEGELKDVLTRDRNWDAEECLDKGLVDEII